MDGLLASVTVTDPVKEVTMNWGVNEMGALPAEATWEANYEAIIDKVHTKWPDAQIRLMYPWKQGFDADAATLHGWVNVIVAARGPYTHSGADEAVWLKGSDNGVSETVDGIHYSTLGKSLCAKAWLTAMGY